MSVGCVGVKIDEFHGKKVKTIHLKLCCQCSDELKEEEKNEDELRSSQVIHIRIIKK